MNARIIALGLGLGVSVVAATACNAITPDLLGPGGPHDAGSMSGTDGSVSTLPDMPEPGLILRYEFEDSGTSVQDVSGRHKDGVALVSGATGTADTPTKAVWTTSGRIGHALALTGQQHVALPAGVLTGVTDFTIATWVMVNTTLPWARIYDFGNDGNTNWMFLTIDGFKPNVTPAVDDGVHISSFGGSITNENVVATSTHLPTSVWKHIAVTGTGGDRVLYIDGFPAGTITGGPNVPPEAMEPMDQFSWLGKSHFPDAGLNGTLDDFRIYNRVLSQTEIADLAAPQHDYSYWRFDEATGSNAKDSSDNANTGTGNQVTWTTGRLGSAVKLAGAPPGSSGPHVALASNPLASCTEFTVAAWIMPSSIDISKIFDFGTGTDTFISLSLSDGTGMHFTMAAPGKTTFNLATASQPLSVDGKWHHVAVTLLSGAATIYVDGAAISTGSGAAIKPTDVGATTQNWIGRSRASGDRFFNGAVDELRVACRAFTADEIINLSRP